MKGIVFLDIDTQHNFMHKDGKFYVPDAEKIIPNLKKITEFAKKNSISIAASIDLQKTSKVKVLTNIPANGYKKIPETILPNTKTIPNKKLSYEQLKKLLGKYERFLIFKQKNDIFSNPNLKSILSGAKDVYVYGVATDFCVKAAVLGLRNIGIETYVVKDAVKPLFKKNEKKDFALFRKKGAKFLTTKQLIKKGSISLFKSAKGTHKTLSLL